MDRARLAIIGLLYALALTPAQLANCQILGLPGHHGPAPCKLRVSAPLPTQAACLRGGRPLGSLIEASCAELRTAEGLDAQGLDASVDSYYRATLHAAQALQAGDPLPPEEHDRLWQTYHRGLTGLVVAGQRYGRFNPGGKLVVRDGLPRQIPVTYHGFAWRPCDFTRVDPAEEFHSKELSQHIIHCGIGLPLVGERITACEEKFFRHQQTFAITAVLRPVMPGEMAEVPGCESVLQFYNPHVTTRVDWCGGPRPLARDLSAPLSAIIIQTPRQYLRGFTAPTDVDVKPKLIMTEPYQRGKIPLVLVHGMYSDPITWADATNELRAQRDIYARYQVWLYRYPTGGAVLESAAAMRADLRLARQVCDPQHCDPALDAMVLVGHSLGGLVSKMQVVASQDLLWNEAASQPLDRVRASPEILQRLSADFFFEPVTSVTRVVFIGTPHKGSSMARRLAGRVGSSLVSFGGEAREQYLELMDNNRDIFKPALTNSRPTSVNLMEPDNPFLMAINAMQICPRVRIHTIAGTGGMASWGEPTDGVVTLSSARHRGATSELFVPAKHEYLHRDDTTIAELARILRDHAAETSLR